jgi:hypothetical protein
MSPDEPTYSLIGLAAPALREGRPLPRANSISS